MKQNANLQQALRHLAATLPRQACPATEQRLRAAFRARHKPSPRAWTYWTTAAACLALAFAIFWEFHLRRPSQSNPASTDTYASATAGFIPLPYGQSDVPLEQAVIVRVRLQPSEWGPLGVPVSANKTTETISADLLIGQDGVARAVRLVSAP